MTEKTEKPPESQTPDLQPVSPKPIDAQQLFRGSREVCIEHAGVRYRLRITRRNRLILQK